MHYVVTRKDERYRVIGHVVAIINADSEQAAQDWVMSRVIRTQARRMQSFPYPLRWVMRTHAANVLYGVQELTTWAATCRETEETWVITQGAVTLTQEQAGQELTSVVRFADNLEEAHKIVSSRAYCDWNQRMNDVRARREKDAG